MSETEEQESQPELEGSLDQLVLIVGYSTQGKSDSLRNIRNQERWVYLNTNRVSDCRSRTSSTGSTSLILWM